MVFSSNIFLFAFLPLFLAAYYLTPLRFRSVTILIGSYVFYAWWRVDFTLLFLGVTVFNYILQKLIHDTRGQLASKNWLIIGIIGNLITLGFFKYFNFGIDSLNSVFNASGMQPIQALEIILPIGISFYIFHGISFLIDIYKDDAPPPRSFWDFAAFMALFPHLIAGPVLRYKDLAEQFRSRTHDMAHFSEGAYRFMQGFAMKVLIADSVAPLSDMVFAKSNPTFLESWMGAFAYTIQLFFDFAGYSVMAVGLGLMMGFRLIENFRHPYISRSITEFWQRWHISLSTWLRDYLYIPLGGNRKGTLRTYINLFLTMLLGGLWHGANWTFVLWGAWHGALLAIERAMNVKTKAVHWIMVIPTFIFVMIGWIMFRAHSVGDAFDFYQAMIGLNGFGISEELAWQVKGMSVVFLGVGLLLLIVGPKYLDFRKSIPDSPAMSNDGYKNPAIATGTIALFLIAMTKLASESYSPFLYFQF